MCIAVTHFHLNVRNNRRVAFNSFPFHFVLQASDVWEDLLASVSRRNFLLEFSQNPTSAFEHLLTSRHLDFLDYGDPIDSLREFEFAGNQKTEMYYQVYGVIRVLKDGYSLWSSRQWPTIWFMVDRFMICQTTVFYQVLGVRFCSVLLCVCMREHFLSLHKNVSSVLCSSLGRFSQRPRTCLIKGRTLTTSLGELLCLDCRCIWLSALT